MENQEKGQVDFLHYVLCTLRLPLAILLPLVLTSLICYAVVSNGEAIRQGVFSSIVSLLDETDSSKFLELEALLVSISGVGRVAQVSAIDTNGDFRIINPECEFQPIAELLESIKGYDIAILDPSTYGLTRTLQNSIGVRLQFPLDPQTGITVEAKEMVLDNAILTLDYSFNEAGQYRWWVEAKENTFVFFTDSLQEGQYPLEGDYMATGLRPHINEC